MARPRKPASLKKRTVSLYVSVKNLEGAQAIANAENRTLSDMIDNMITFGIADYYSAEEDAAEYEAPLAPAASSDGDE